MSLLNLASLQSVANFCRNTAASNSFVVVFPFDPATATTGKVKSLRYRAPNSPNARRVSATAISAAPGSSPSPLNGERAGLPAKGSATAGVRGEAVRSADGGSKVVNLSTLTTTATAPFFATSPTKLCSSNFSSANATQQ